MKKEIIVLNKYESDIWAILKLECPLCGERFRLGELIRKTESQEKVKKVMKFVHEDCYEIGWLKRSGNLE